jgi:hypothetical protein
MGVDLLPNVLAEIVLNALSQTLPLKLLKHRLGFLEIWLTLGNRSLVKSTEYFSLCQRQAHDASPSVLLRMPSILQALEMVAVRAFRAVATALQARSTARR